MNAHTQETQKNITPEKALQYLKEGNKRFVNNSRADRNLLEQVQQTKNGQFPFATILSCMDSRTSAELIFDQGFGDIFSIRIAGNIVNEDILGSIEYGTKVVGTKIIVVLGHTACGAVKGACDSVELGNITGLLQKIQPAIEQEKTVTSDRNSSNEDFVNKVTKNNVNLAIKDILDKSPIVKELVDNKSVMIVGGVYDVATGEVTFY